MPSSLDAHTVADIKFERNNNLIRLGQVQPARVDVRNNPQYFQFQIAYFLRAKGSVKNNLVEFAHKFAVDLTTPQAWLSKTAGIASYFEDFCE